METTTLKATARTIMGRKTDALRADNTMPAVIYGLKQEPINIQVSRSEFDRAYQDAGESTVVQLDVDGTMIPVLIHDTQYDTMTDFTTHADFIRVDMNKPVEAKIQILLTGESAAVEVMGGVLVHSTEELEVRALPSALVREIELDLSALKTLDDVLRVSDIKVPAGIEVLTEGNMVVVSVQPPRNEKDLEDLNAPVNADISAVEVTTEKKEEAEEAK